MQFPRVHARFEAHPWMPKKDNLMGGEFPDWKGLNNHTEVLNTVACGAEKEY